MTVPFVPSPHEEERIPSPGYDVIAEYRRALNEANGWTEEPKNVTFKHDPEWRGRLMSIQAARDSTQSVTGGSWFWKFIGVLMALSTVSYWGLRFMR